MMHVHPLCIKKIARLVRKTKKLSAQFLNINSSVKIEMQFETSKCQREKSLHDEIMKREKVIDFVSNCINITKYSYLSIAEL